MNKKVISEAEGMRKDMRKIHNLIREDFWENAVTYITDKDIKELRLIEISANLKLADKTIRKIYNIVNQYVGHGG